MEVNASSSILLRLDLEAKETIKSVEAYLERLRHESGCPDPLCAGVGTVGRANATCSDSEANQRC
eukprot:138443-Amphidinium_carterae.1